MSDDIEKLIKEHSGFIRKLSHKYGNNNNKEDLYQEGVIGLMMAAKKFNPEHKVKFLTYANYWIFKYIVNFLKFENKIIPTDLEKYSKDNLNEEPWTEVESTIEANILKEKATKIMVNKNITLRDIDIIMNRYLTPDPETLQTLGDKYNISRERVRQIESKWTNIIKKKLNL